MKEIGLILLIKLILLLGIRSIWFSAPVEVMDDGVKVGQHVLGPTPTPPEKPPQ
ncbi:MULTISPECIES: cytochrome oxidase putative small subunit CydP [unclassified Pseudomonas]